MPTTITTVDDYIAAQPEDVQPQLERMRAIIRKALPGVEEAISYQIAGFKVQGRFVIYMSAAKQHVGLYPATESMIEALGDELAPHLSGKATMRFLYADRIPTKLVERVVKLRLKEVQGEAAAAAAKKKR